MLAQQIELEEKIALIQELDAERGNVDDLNTDARERYHEFTDTLKNWHIKCTTLKCFRRKGRSSSLFVALPRACHTSPPFYPQVLTCCTSSLQK